MKRQDIEMYLLWLLISPLWLAVLAYDKARALIRRVFG